MNKDLSVCVHFAEVSLNKMRSRYQQQDSVVQLTLYSDLPVREGRQRERLSSVNKRVSVAS